MQSTESEQSRQSPWLVVGLSTLGLAVIVLAAGFYFNWTKAPLAPP